MEYITNFIKVFKRIYLFLPLVLMVSIFLTFFNLKQVEASTLKEDKLIELISKDYTSKFCNSVAFGLSKESAMNFAFKENNLRFQGKKYFDSLNKDSIANKISISVVEDCGYLVNLKGQESITQFKNDYLSMNKE